MMSSATELMPKTCVCFKMATMCLCTTFDIIRVDKNGKVAEHWDAMTVLVKETAKGGGKIVEHWDVIQEMPSERLANTNGMFGF
jgi:predicted SnoaL-like aldol condensation-catalyzing enzyme